MQVTRHRARDLRHLEAVRQARAKEIALMVDENLGFVFEAAECGRVHDAVAVALEFTAAQGRGLAVEASTRVVRTYRVRRELSHVGAWRQALRRWRLVARRR